MSDSKVEDRCVKCDGPAGVATKDYYAFYINGIGPLCKFCFDDITDMNDNNAEYRQTLGKH